MKKMIALALAAFMMASLAACGSKKKETKEVDLTSFYDTLAAEYDWADYLADTEGEMLEMYYPGLGEITTKQMIAKAPRMSSVVNEMVFLQCETEDDAAKAAEILQQRIDAQAEGGAWYPESIEGWKNDSKIVSNGNYVMMIAFENSANVVAAFNALFAS